MAENAVVGALRVNLRLDTAEFQNGLKAVTSQMGGLGKLFSGLAAAGVFTALSAGIGSAVGRIEEMRKLSVQLDRALENTGNTARTSAEEVATFADSLERSTGRAAEEIMAVSTNLATFGFNRQVFFEAIELADDMAAAWGGDLKQNVEGLSRALADPEKGLAMLTKRGITFTDEQKKMIAGFMKANDLIGAQGVILDTLQEQVQGVAEAGFSGLTKATANAWKGVEDLFEAMANGMQVNLGLELTLVAVAEALSFVTDNMGTLAKIAGVVGVAVLTAIGPAVWSALSTAAIAFGAAAVAAIRAIGVAIALNPIGAVIIALSAAVSAAFLFRDEIKQAIGVDFVQIVIDAGNKLIGVFVGAYQAVTEAWSNLPTFFSGLGKQAWNSFVAEFEKPALTINDIVIIPGMNLDSLKSQLTQAEKEAASVAGTTFDKAFNRDYIGQMFSGVGDAAAAAGGSVKGFGDLLDQTSTSGGAGVDALKGKVEGLGGAFGSVKDTLSELVGNVKTGLASMASNVAKSFFTAGDAATNALNAAATALDNIASKAFDMAFNGIFDAIFGAIGGAFSGGAGLGSGAIGRGVYGGSGGFFPAFPGLATGGRTMTAGLVEVGERGRELLHLPAGAQVIRNSDIGNLAAGGGGRMRIELGPGLVASILDEAAGQTVDVVKAYDSNLGATVADKGRRAVKGFGGGF